MRLHTSRMKNVMTVFWAVFYCVFAYGAIVSMSALNTMVTSDAPIGQVFVYAFMGGLSFGMMALERLMPSEQEFEKAAKQRGYLKVNDNEEDPR